MDQNQTQRKDSIELEEYVNKTDDNVVSNDQTLRSNGDKSKNEKINSNSLSMIYKLLISLKPEYITPTCKENLSSIQTLLNNILKRSIGHTERIRTPKFSAIQESVFVQVLKKGETRLARNDWATLNHLAEQDVPKLVVNKGESPLVFPPSNLPLPDSAQTDSNQINFSLVSGASNQNKENNDEFQEVTVRISESQ